MNKSLNTAVMATAHCLLGCSIGEILGMVISAGLDLSNFYSIIISIFLAFVFGYSLTLLPLNRHLGFKKALRIAVASDTASISTMELMDNLVIVLIPSALDAKLTDLLFWGSLAVSLVVAFLVTVPVNYILIKRGLGHAMHHGTH
jgi:hypothetical protein